MSITTPTTSAPAPALRPVPPAWWLLGLEPVRAAIEYAGSQLRLRRARGEAAGDGHTVVVFPGLASNGRSVSWLVDFCRSQGYDAHDWGRGFNTGPRGDVDAWLDGLADDVCTLAARNPHGQRHVSLVGWSLGGLYAREVAKKLGSAQARGVITLGTPFAGTVAQTRAGLLYRLLNGAHPVLDAAMSRRLATPPDVPTTSIYSRSDGVVHWQACCHADGCHAMAENVEIPGSHCGLVWNGEVFRVLADRLAQPLGGWRPYAAACPDAAGSEAALSRPAPRARARAAAAMRAAPAAAAPTARASAAAAPARVSRAAA
jgi:hypothetical protein